MLNLPIAETNKETPKWHFLQEMPNCMLITLVCFHHGLDSILSLLHMDSLFSACFLAMLLPKVLFVN